MFDFIISKPFNFNHKLDKIANTFGFQKRNLIYQLCKDLDRRTDRHFASSLISDSLAFKQLTGNML